jgi:hypothetical protein
MITGQVLRISLARYRHVPYSFKSFYILICSSCTNHYFSISNVHPNFEKDTIDSQQVT